MSAAVSPRLLVCASEPAAQTELRRVLHGGGHDVAGHLLGTPDPDQLAGLHLVVVDGSRPAAGALDFCRRFRHRLEEAFVPILFVTDDPSPAARLAGFEAGADTYLLRPFAPGELLAQVEALLRIKETHDRLTEKTAEVHRINKRLQQAYQQIDQELELAQRIQSSFLPQTLPEVPRRPLRRPLPAVRPGRRRLLRRLPPRREARRLLRRRRDGPRRPGQPADDLRQEGRQGEGGVRPAVPPGAARRGAVHGSTAT